MENPEPAVLACVDGSSVSETVCDYACWISQRTGAPLKLLHTIEPPIAAPASNYSGAIGLGAKEDLLDELIAVEQNRSKLMVEKGQLMLEAAQNRVQQNGIIQAERCQRHGNLSEALIELEHNTRVLVLGIRGEAHDTEQAGIGTQLENVIRALHKPIFVVNTEFREPKRVMLAYDGSPGCQKALEMICQSPLMQTLPCKVVHVGNNGEQLLNEAETALKEAGVDCETAQLNGKVDEAIALYQAENDIDLMLMGAFSHSRFRDFLWGSFTAKMLKKTNTPLLLLR